MKINDHNGTRVHSPKVTANIIQSILASYDDIEQGKEHFYTLLLDARMKIKSIDLISVGTNDSSIAHPRDIFRRAILENANHIIIAHNHPSNESEPSHADLMLTQRVKKAGEIIGITLLDHIIVTDSDFTSLAGQNLL